MRQAAERTLLTGLVGAALIGVCALVSPDRLYAATAPSGEQPDAGSPTPVPADHRELLNRYCVTCHNDRLQTGNLSFEADGFRPRGSRHRGVGKGDPQTAVGHDAAGRTAAAGAGRIRVLRLLAGNHDRRGRRRESASGPADGATAQSDRIHERDPRSAGSGDRRPRTVAGRRHGVWLRQQRRPAADFDGAARALHVGGREDQPAGGRRPCPPSVAGHSTTSRDSGCRTVGSVRTCRSEAAAARRGGITSRSTPSTS